MFMGLSIDLLFQNNVSHLYYTHPVHAQSLYRCRLMSLDHRIPAPNTGEIGSVLPLTKPRVRLQGEKQRTHINLLCENLGFPLRARRNFVSFVPE